MRTDRLWLILFFLLPGVLVIAETLSFGFVSDDFVLVQRVRTQGFFSSWGGGEGTVFFRPVTVLSYVFDNLIWGTKAFGYHLTNVVWHFLCSFLVVFLGLELFRSREQAFLAGFLFLLLACHSESVSWVSGRTDLIATAFSLLSVILFLRGSFLCLLFYLAAVFSKESAFLVPVVWLLFLWPFSVAVRRKTLLALGGIVVAGGYLLVRILSATDIQEDLLTAGAGISLFSIIENLFRYSFRIFIPPLPGVIRPFLERFQFLPPLLLAGLLSGALCFLKGKNSDRKTMTLLLGSFLLMLIPVLFMSVSLFDSRSERFLYLPGVFAVLLLVKWSFTVFSRRAAIVFLLLFSLFQGAFLYRSNRNWEIAGDMCRAIVLQGSCEYPDSFNGAYVFRNGHEEALLLFSE